ncbi:MAG: four helix bundle protein [Melioribacteraceae bacterium]|nr:four helix bundle protein [Melioribacteraceae bacterium]MCF8355947.1 four helix bundle protein [Melioribacteraceae bacterium]MCF8395808.1 four helix bundle protein [Melioribacteraceae bacterium]MCF8420800.1 four helix bundle protein [Melioribacteraceae bacterium]
MHNFKELKIWQNSKDLVIDVYRKTESFPKEEIFSLTNQIRRSAVSIPSNIAEGCGRNSDKDLIRFLDIANGSSFELETQLIIAHELEFLSSDNFIHLDENLREIQRMNYGFRNNLINKLH